MLKVLLIAKVAHRRPLLQSAFADYQIVAVLSDGLDLKLQLRACNPDVIVIDLAHPDGDTLTQVGLAIGEEPKPVVMFAANDDTTAIREAVEAGVSAYVFDGIPTRGVRPIIDMAVAYFEQMQALRRALQATENRLAERKFIERAKGLLMKRRNLSEDAAYRAMRKQAMDNNIQLAQVARRVIAIEELL